MRQVRWLYFFKETKKKERELTTNFKIMHHKNVHVPVVKGIMKAILLRYIGDQCTFKYTDIHSFHSEGFGCDLN